MCSYKHNTQKSLKRRAKIMIFFEITDKKNKKMQKSPSKSFNISPF